MIRGNTIYSKSARKNIERALIVYIFFVRIAFTSI